VSWTAPFTYTTGQVLTAANLNTYLRDNTDFLGGAARPHSRVYNSANQAATTGVRLTVLFDSERVDVGAIHSTVTNTGRLTVPSGAAGWWNVGAQLIFAANATGVREFIIQVNGATDIAFSAGPAPTAADIFGIPFSTSYQMAVGDYFTCQGYQTSGGNLNINATGNYSPEFWCQWECV
jgi:hypothetical protein